MALTDVFISPAGAGDNSGSSIANALPAINSGDWSTNIEGLDRANKRFIFLTGTYNVTTQLIFSGSTPTDEQPNQWVGADASGNILRPKWLEGGLRLDLTDYPKFVCSTDLNQGMVQGEEFTYYKCLSFENTNASYSQGSIVEEGTTDTDQQAWYGCSFKAAPNHDTSEIMIISSTSFYNCVFEATTQQFDRVVDVRANSRIYDCRFIGGGLGSGSGDGVGLEVTTHTTDIRNCVITNCHGDGVRYSSTSSKASTNISDCTIVNNGGDGIDATAGGAAGIALTPHMESNIIFGNGAFGIAVNAVDDRGGGIQMAAMGSNSSGNFSNLDSFEDMIDVVTVTTADFFDYANFDYRIKRSSALYKFFQNRNFGALQNEDFEFASVS